MDTVFRSRKFQLAVFFSLADTIGFYFNYMDASLFVMAQGVILGMYGAMNVASKGK